MSEGKRRKSGLGSGEKKTTLGVPPAPTVTSPDGDMLIENPFSTVMDHDATRVARPRNSTGEMTVQRRPTPPSGQRSIDSEAGFADEKTVARRPSGTHDSPRDAARDAGGSGFGEEKTVARAVPADVMAKAFGIHVNGATPASEAKAARNEAKADAKRSEAAVSEARDARSEAKVEAKADAKVEAKRNEAKANAKVVEAPPAEPLPPKIPANAKLPEPKADAKPTDAKPGSKRGSRETIPLPHLMDSPPGVWTSINLRASPDSMPEPTIEAPTTEHPQQRGTLERYLRARGVRPPQMRATIPGPASFAFSFGTVLMFLLAVEVVTGIALAMFYAPSTTDAWASVAYVQDQATLGWMIRGLHYHASSALVIVTGVHLVQTALSGAYRKPRELIWWLGILLMVLNLAWAVTGYVLRWDQAGYWANQVELGIVAATPVVGGVLKAMLVGGNDAGNLTLTRFYALHVLVLPIAVIAATWAHVALARKLGGTPLGARERTPRLRWPEQSLRDAVSIAVVFALLVTYVVGAHGADLAAPADPSQAFDARPLWYFRWLYELRELAGSAEKLVALAVPALVGGALVALPLIDRAPTREPRKRLPVLGALAGLLALIGGLTVASLISDAGSEALAKRAAHDDERASLARKLARQNGVPVTGAADVFFTAPMAKGRALFAAHCKSCHAAESKERKGPVIEAGHGNRAWLTAFIQNPNGDEFWGRTKLAKKEAAMKSFGGMPPAELDALVALLAADAGDLGDPAEPEAAKAAKRARGAATFDTACSDCHAREDGMPGPSGPGLAGLGSRAYYLSFISNPKSALHMGRDNSEMPRFDRELSLADRDALAEYLVWLRGVTPADVAALDAP